MPDLLVNTRRDRRSSFYVSITMLMSEAGVLSIDQLL